MIPMTPLSLEPSWNQTIDALVSQVSQWIPKFLRSLKLAWSERLTKMNNIETHFSEAKQEYLRLQL